MNHIKIEGGLYCYIKDITELNEILEREKPEYSYDLIERHREDIGDFDGDGIYKIRYAIINPCEHGFRIKKKERNELNELIINLRNLLDLSDGDGNVSDKFT